MKKHIYIFTTIILSFFLSFCGSNQQPPSSVRTGKQVYEQTCVVCHGFDGNGNTAGAALLSKSILSTDDCILIIKNGKGTMPANLVNDDAEIRAVAEYILTFRK